MQYIGRYQVVSTLHEDPRTRVVRAIDPEGRSVIVKACSKVPPPASARARLRREHDICRDLASRPPPAAGSASERPGRLPIPLGSHELETPAHIVFSDEGGTSLATILRQGPLRLVSALRTAAQVAKLLDRVHAAGIIHKDVKPSNLLLSDDGTVTLLDFGIAGRLRSESHGDVLKGRMDGSLPYMSPEQTGRVNRPVDTRSDLYSLGVTLFECLTGRVPFPSSEAAEIIYGHVARQPPAPSTVKSTIPSAVDAVVARLLEKSAEHRYQSAAGVAADLSWLADALDRKLPLGTFMPGRSDFTTRFTLPWRIYGREAELQDLGSLYERAAKGASELALVRGWSGVGKTSLVAELSRQVALSRGRFVQGKFDQFRRSSPYHCVLLCFSELFSQLLTESDASIRTWRDRIAHALGSSLNVLHELVPESAAVIGFQHPPEELDPEAAKQRLSLLVRELLRVFSRPERPLVVFLDDLQWSDLGSLELLRTLATGAEIPYLLLVGSYRSNEIDATHPLAVTLSAITQNRRAPLKEIELSGLPEAALVEFVSDAFAQPPAAVEHLAQLVHEKTDGNPYFVRELLLHLSHNGALSRAPSGGFTVDVNALKRSAVTDNVVEHLVDRITRSGERARSTLSVAAALGTTFDFRLLEATVQLGSAALSKDLWYALSEGLIAPLDEDYDLVGLMEDDSISPRYAFQHDKVQQAAYELLPVEDRPALHLRIAGLLAGDADRLFERADHLLNAENVLVDDASRVSAAVLFGEVGGRARHSAAYGPGVTYLAAARRLLGPSGFESHHDLMMAATLDLATCEYLCGNIVVAEGLFVEAYGAARSDLARAHSFVLRVALRLGRSEVIGALDLAREGLALCGETLNLEPDAAAVGAAFGELNEALAGRTLSQLATIPEATDQLKQAALEILNDTAAPAYYVNENVYALIILKMCTISARYGQTPVSSFGWALYGVVLGPILGDFATSSEAARLARQVQGRFGRASMDAKVALCLCGFVDHWTQPPLETIPGLEAGVRAGLSSGDPVFATFCTLAMGYTWLLTGLEAGMLLTASTALCDTVEQLGFTEAQGVHEVNARLAKALTAQTGASASLGVDEAEWLGKLDGYALRIPIHMALLAKLELSLVFDVDLDDSLMTRSAALLPRSLGTGHHSVHAWLSALAASRRLEQDPSDAVSIERFATSVTQIDAWAAANPGSFEHKRLGLLALEHARNGRFIEAMDHFDSAISSAVQAHFVKNAALLADAAARIFRRSGRDRLADAYLQEAVLRYREWGAMRRVHELERTHRWLRDGRRFRSSAASDTGAPELTSAVSTYHTTSDARGVDDWSLVKASQALAGEMRFHRLVELLVENLMQSSGAQRVLLFVPARDGAELRVAAEGSAEMGSVVGTGTLSTRTDIPRAVISYVRRAVAPAIVVDVAEPGRFAEDPFIQANRTESLLCVPAAHGGRLEAVIYLDNGLLPGCFTPDRVQIVSVLASQLAISLANTRLFEEADRQARAFARFVPAEFLNHLRTGRKRDLGGGHQGEIADVALGDSVRCDMAVLFADLRSYTLLSEEMSPEDNFTFVNEYLSRIGPVIREHGGFIDKYIGDAIMALFTSPDEAVGAAEEIFARTGELNLLRAERGEGEIRVGVGLHYGSLMLGIVGEAERLDVTVISDVVNVASRLERLCKHFEVRIVASDALLAACQDPAVISRRRLGNLEVAGRKARVPAFELLGADSERLRRAKELTRGQFEDAVAAAEAGDGESARALLARVLALNPEDATVRRWLALTGDIGQLQLPQE